VCASQAARIAIEPDGSYVQVAADGKKTKLQKAAITLNDCLACRWDGRPACVCVCVASRSLRLIR
jgi:hypothetical protein